MTTYTTHAAPPGIETVPILPGETARILVRSNDLTVIDGGLLWRPATLAELVALDTGGYPPRPKPTPPKPQWIDEYAANRPPVDRARGNVHDPVMAATRRPFLRTGRRRKPGPRLTPRWATGLIAVGALLALQSGVALLVLGVAR